MGIKAESSGNARATPSSELRVVRASVAGSNHTAQGLPNQDSINVESIGQNGWLFAVADGAGSRALSAIGSTFAVKAAAAAAANVFTRPPSNVFLHWKRASAEFAENCIEH